jgi:glycosyltransferase involved in cell wall biosynthesis
MIGGEVVRLFKTGDASSLASALSELLDNAEARQQLGASARLFALREFSIEAHVAKLRDLYQSLIS